MKPNNIGYFTTDQLKAWIDYKRALLDVITEDDPRVPLIHQEVEELEGVISDRVKGVIKLL